MSCTACGGSGHESQHCGFKKVIDRIKAMQKDPIPMHEKYPAYYKDVRHLDFIDVYQVHSLFQIDDPSGCLHHAGKKILLSGVRTGGKPKAKDIQEAYDTLGRWLEMNGKSGEA